MDFGAPGSSGLLGSLRGFADNVFGSVQDRVELLAIELQEEKHRLIQTLIWIVAFVCSAALAVTFVSVALVVGLWNTPARVPLVVLLALAYVAAAVYAGWKLRACLTQQPKPLAATIEELGADRECIQPKS